MVVKSLHLGLSSPSASGQTAHKPSYFSIILEFCPNSFRWTFNPSKSTMGYGNRSFSGFSLFWSAHWRWITDSSPVCNQIWNFHLRISDSLLFLTWPVHFCDCSLATCLHRISNSFVAQKTSPTTRRSNLSNIHWTPANLLLPWPMSSREAVELKWRCKYETMNIFIIVLQAARFQVLVPLDETSLNYSSVYYLVVIAF